MLSRLHTVSEVCYVCEETEEGETLVYRSLQMMWNRGVKLLRPSLWLDELKGIKIFFGKKI
jgi:hypothetical protein